MTWNSSPNSIDGNSSSNSIDGNSSPNSIDGEQWKPNSIVGNSSPQCVGCDGNDVTIDLVNWMFEAQSDDVISLLERKIVSITVDDYPLDYYSLGHCIAHSQCQWVLSLDGEDIGEEEVRMLVAGASTRQETSGRVVGLRGWWADHYYMPLFISAEGLNMLFTQWKSVLHLHELHLDLPVPCDGITWPDLSGLRVLTLGIEGKKNWRLDTLLPHLSLQSLYYCMMVF